MGMSDRWWISRVVICLLIIPRINGWGKDGHYVICKIAENYLTEDAVAAVKALLPDHAKGDCHDSAGRKHRCVTGAIYNYTAQLIPSVIKFQLYPGTFSEKQALLVAPLHVGFTGDEGGNTIVVRWYRRKTNLHHVWDNMIIESALKTFYNSDLTTMIQSIQRNITEAFVEVSTQKNCKGAVCPNPYASESVNLACKFAYRNATPGTTLGGKSDPGISVLNDLSCSTDDYFLSRLPVVEDRLAQAGVRLAALLNSIFSVPWSKEGHAMTCKIAQVNLAPFLTIPAYRQKQVAADDMLEPEAKHAVQMLLPDYVNGDLSALCVWPDQVRHWYSIEYWWMYKGDCHDPHGVKDMCVAGAIQNFTNQLSHYRHGTSDRRHNMTEALLFLAHFMGDIHQPMHVGFTSDEGGNTIDLRWFRHKSNLHHVWDREIILTAAADYYGKDINLLQEDIEGNFTDGIWSADLASWRDCTDLVSCVNKYAAESINIACKWGYKDVESGDTLSDNYFNSRLPIVMKRIAQGGVRLAMILNRVLGDHTEENDSSVAPT
ncbi:Endonuclease 1 [Sesamum angolense]|uniref:Aspergillus nuclease S1 n=1 Tax=Sesamum angolense TaxID=2727404 RepID=A0AAE2BV92_9LAMI|nr:Endonuclease 1 [Sesamum angolense]